MGAGSRVARGGRVPFGAMLAANAISFVGNEISYLAIPWFVLETTGSAARTGLTAAASIVAAIVASVMAGALVDRVGFKRMCVLSDIASGVNVALIPLLHALGLLSFPLLLALVFLGALLDTPGYTARASLIPDLITGAGMRPERGNASVAMAHRLAGLAGAPLAGILIATLGTSTVLWIDAVSFALSAALIAGFVPAAARTVRAAATSYVGELVEGLRFIRRDGLLLPMLLVSAAGSLLAEPVYSVILPVMAREVYGSPVDLGLMFAALGGGSLLGGALYLWRGHRMPRRVTFFGGYLVRALTFWALVPTPALPVVMGSIVVNAVGLEPVNPLRNTIMQERVPVELRGRVFGAAAALGMMTMPLGMIGYGLLIERAGLGTALWVLASVNLLVPLAILLTPAFNRLDAPRDVPAPALALAD